MTWQMFFTAALGISAMIAGGFLMHTPAGAPLLSSGGTLVGLAIPWPKGSLRNSARGNGQVEE